MHDTVTLRKRDHIISADNFHVKKTSHKYGVEVPLSLKHAFAMDEKNGNTHWRDAVNKDMGNLKVAFDIQHKDPNPPPGFDKASGHNMVFDVCMTQEQKARWVKDGHCTPEPENCTYAGVKSRESICIALTCAALNDLPVFGADIQNAYLQAPTTEKHYIICGPEFRLDPYGGKSACSYYWRHVRKAMEEMGSKVARPIQMYGCNQVPRMTSG